MNFSDLLAPVLAHTRCRRPCLLKQVGPHLLTSSITGLPDSWAG